MDRNALLRDVFRIKEVVEASDYVLQLHTGVDHAAQTLEEYVATASLAKAFDDALAYIESALTGGKSQGVFLHGSFGSGKSHFMAVLDLMLRGEPAARGVPGLQAVVAKREQVLNRKLLTAEYHLIGAKSLEDAMFSGFLRRVKALHPEVTPPMLHKSDQLLLDAAGRRAVNEEAFFAELNKGRAAGGWGDYGGGWTPETYDRAASRPVGHEDRDRLTADLVATMFAGYAAAGEWLDIADGLAVMASTTKSLGYDGLVLFLDELVLWLASHAANTAFVAQEASKVAKLVETGVGTRPVPMLSFVARQRELSDFIGDAAAGVQRAQVGQAIQYWEDRFNTITLSASNLPDVAHKRLLTPVSEEAAAVVAGAVAMVKASSAWDVLLQDEAGADEAAFAKVYPFSPALVDVLVALSGRLQRERTALKVMALLLSRRRESGRIQEIIGVGDLYDVMIAEGEQPLTEEMRRLFALARDLYEKRFVPVLMRENGITSLEGLPADHPFVKEARLAKTLVVAALVPEVVSLKDLKAGRLAALNHGTVQAWIPGEEATQVLQKVRLWAQHIGELRIGEGADPTIAVELTGVDYESVLARVENEDTPGARRTLLRRLLFTEMGIPEQSQMQLGGLSVERVWRGTRRVIDVVFGNIRDESTLPDAMLMADGERWKLVVDYPFDEGDHGPQEDVNRFDELRISGAASRTVGWVPLFLSADRLVDLGKLVQLEHLLGGQGGQFDHNAAHLPVDQREMARQALENLRRSTRERIRNSLRQAYGLIPAGDDVDTGFGRVTLLPTLWRDKPLDRPVGATLAEALDAIMDQMLTLQYPDHPKFDSPKSEVRNRDLKVVWEVVQKAAASPNGRLDPVEQNRRAEVRRLAGPLGLGFVGDSHFVFDEANFAWLKMFLQNQAAQGYDSGVPVSALRDWLAPYGLTRDMANLVIACYALLRDKQFEVHGANAHVAGFAVRDEMLLVDPRLPDEQDWAAATARAAALFGVQAPKMRTAANVSTLAGSIEEAARGFRQACASLSSALDRHAVTLGLGDTSARRVTAHAGVAVVEGLLVPTDDVDRVAALAAMALPEEPQALARSMASATDVSKALTHHDWTTLDAVAREADAGDESAAAVLAPLRKVAAAEEMHSPLQTALASAHTGATQWLLDRKPPPPQPPVDTTPVGTPPKGPGTHPDEVELDLDTLDRHIAEVAGSIRSALEKDPGKKVTITWRLR